MVTITFPDRATETKALGLLLGARGDAECQAGQRGTVDEAAAAQTFGRVAVVAALVVGHDRSFGDGFQ